MRILVCDDEALFLEQLAAQVREYMELHHIECDITITTDPGEVLAAEQNFDLAFLDIQLGKTDGISLARELKRRSERLSLFFVTNHRVYQDEAMDLEALRFFEKPVDLKRLHSGLDSAMERIEKFWTDIFVSSERGQRRVLVDDIMYVSRDNRRVFVQTLNETISARDSFEELCQKLPGLFFYLVHNSFFVNLHHVERYSNSELVMRDGRIISIASRKRANFRKFWFEYLSRR